MIRDCRQCKHAENDGRIWLCRQQVPIMPTSYRRRQYECGIEGRFFEAIQPRNEERRS